MTTGIGNVLIRDEAGSAPRGTVVSPTGQAYHVSESSTKFAPAALVAARRRCTAYYLAYRVTITDTQGIMPVDDDKIANAGPRRRLGTQPETASLPVPA